MQNSYITLTNRALLTISGDDARSFLQGLITNNINKLDKDNALYALMLSPQGKFLYDFFFYEIEGKIFADVNSEKLPDIKKKLNMYKLRSKVTIEDISEEYCIVAGEEGFIDPRSPNLPHRSIVNKNSSIQGDIKDYESLRISLCLPSDADMGFDKSFPLEFEMDKHNAIDYEKGCYVGQEITARTHYRGTLRKKPYVVTTDESVDLSEYSGEEITSGTAKIGVLCSTSGNKAIALLRIEDVEKAGEIVVGGITLKI